MTPTEINLIEKAACDLATGNHFLYPRSEEEMAMLKEVCEALNTPEENQTARQKDICEEYRLCTDYDDKNVCGKPTASAVGKADKISKKSF